MTLSEDHSGVVRHGVPLPRSAPWPRQSPLTPEAEAAAEILPVPALSVFEIREGLRIATRGLTHRAEQASGRDVHEAISAAAGRSARMVRGKPHHGTARRAANHGSRSASHRRGGAPKHLAQARKRNA